MNLSIAIFQQSDRKTDRQVDGGGALNGFTEVELVQEDPVFPDQNVSVDFVLQVEKEPTAPYRLSDVPPRVWRKWGELEVIQLNLEVGVDLRGEGDSQCP